MKVGFTGTQKGMTPYQKQEVDDFLWCKHLNQELGEVHHGDCIGADDEFNTIAGKYYAKRIAHPSNIDSKRAWCTCEVVLPAKPPLIRNHDIVDAVDVMIATPKTRYEELRSGTWATIRYARKAGKKVHVIYPERSSE